MMSSQPKNPGTDTPTRFLLVEDHPFYAEGFMAAIKRVYPAAQMTHLSCGADALRLADPSRFDLIFIDVRLPDMNGFDVLNDFLQRAPSARTVILSGYIDESINERARQCGATGVVSKRHDALTLQRICQRLMKGVQWFEETRQWSFAEQAAACTAALTLREMDVLKCLGEGLENREIGTRLNVSDATLRTHLKSIFQKMSVSNRTACVVKAIKTGLL